LVAKSKRTSIDLDRKLDRSACVDRKPHFDRISIGISVGGNPARSLENGLGRNFRHFSSRLSGNTNRDQGGMVE
jgi:hypothetical protein